MPKKTVLLIEDYEDSRAMMKYILEDWGYRVIEAENGQTAVEFVKKEFPDLILMDISLPDIDGMTVTRRIKGIVNADEIPIICLTAHAEDYEIEAIEAGCKAVVAKPLNFEVFRRILSEHLNDV